MRFLFHVCYSKLNIFTSFSTYFFNSNSPSFIHLAVCLTTGRKPLPKRALHIVRSRNSSFKWEYPPPSLRSSSSFLRLHPRLPVTFISPFIFPSITCCRRQLIRKIQLNLHYVMQLDYNENVFAEYPKIARGTLEHIRYINNLDF